MKDTILSAVLGALIILSGSAIALIVVQQDTRAANYSTPPCQTASAAKLGCRGAGQGKCGNCTRQGATGDAQPTDMKGLEKAVSEYYQNKYDGKDFNVEIKDFGCHQEAYIIKDGQPVKRFSISGGAIYEVG